MGRLTPEYAALYTIFRHIHVRDPEFTPASLLDFGAGLGTVGWAVREVSQGLMGLGAPIVIALENRVLPGVPLVGGMVNPPLEQ